MPPRSLTVGIDVGGTFTDLLAIDLRSNEVKLAKVPTTVDNQAIGFMAALAAAGADPAIVQAIVHGTTTTTNAAAKKDPAIAAQKDTQAFMMAATNPYEATMPPPKHMKHHKKKM